LWNVFCFEKVGNNEAATSGLHIQPGLAAMNERKSLFKKTMLNDEQGFTLAELLVALTIFAVGLLAIASMQVTAIRANSQANRLSTEALLAHGIKEEILARAANTKIFTVDANDVPWDMDPATAGTQLTRIVGSGIYSATYDMVAEYVDNIAMVTVTVTGGGRTATVTGFKNKREG